MFIDYLDFNKSWPNNAYLLPNIDKPTTDSSGFKFIYLMDAYFGCNQIVVEPLNHNKNAFMINVGNFSYKVILFYLNYVRATCQRIMNKILKDQTRYTLEFYMDNMIVKSKEQQEHTTNSKTIFE